MAGLGVATSLGLLANDWRPFLVAFVSIGIALWLIAKGHNWARIILIVCCLGVGLPGLVSGFIEYFLSWASWEELPFVSAPTLMLVMAGILYASDSLSEWSDIRRLGFSAVDWERTDDRGAPPSLSHDVARVDAEKLVRRRKAGIFVSNAVAILTLIAWAVFVGLAVYLWQTGTQSMAEAIDAARETRSSLLVVLFLVSFFVVASLVPVFILAGYLVVFFVPSLLVFPVSLVIAMVWKDPLQLLLLRPFNRQDASKPLRRILRSEVSAFGHCYTLADADLRVSVWQKLPMLYGQLIFLSFRQRKITSPRNLGKLLKAMHARVRRNLNWAVSRDKIFPVACVDAGWQACVRNLVGKSHLVIMDLSGFSENLQWELEFLIESGAIHRTVFLVQGDDQLDVRRKIAKLTKSELQLTFLSYDSAGLERKGSLTQAALDILSTASGRRQ